MADIERKLRGFEVERLLRLPKGDQDRMTIEKMAHAVPQWDIVQRTATVQGELLQRVEHAAEAILPTTEQLVVHEREALKAFFGREISVSEPPQALFTTLERMEHLGISGFEAHSLPNQTLKQTDILPGWKVKPEAWYWQQIKAGRIDKDAATLQEGWYLVDRRVKSNYKEGKQMYEDDYLAPLIKQLRDSGKIEKYQCVPDNSRFGISADEIEQVILPEFAKMIQTEGIVRNKREIEFNVFGNMFYPEWGQTNTWEWFADKVEGGSRLLGGGSGNGGLADVDDDWSDARGGRLGFGPLVEFPSKPR